MEKKDQEQPAVECFGFQRYKCSALNVIVPEECKRCKFKKREMDVTNGVRYPFGRGQDAKP